MGTNDTASIGKSVRPSIVRLKRERELRGWTQSELAERVGTTQVNISRWEKGITFPGPYYRQKLGEIFGKSLEDLALIPEANKDQDAKAGAFVDIADAKSSPHLPLWNVPYRRNPFFTGREDILTHLRTMFKESKAALPQAISGLGGIGKTQIAVEYAYRYRDDYQAIFWATASTRDALSADFTMLAALLDLPEQHEQEQDIVVRAVKRWLTDHTNWLLIMDNTNDLEMIADFLPMQGTGDVLLTTQLQALGTVAQNIEVEKMVRDEGVEFLLRRTKIISANASLEQAMNEESQVQAAEIVAALDGLPLALDQAGAYIEETRCGLSQYLKLYGSRRKELLLRRGRFPIDHPASVVATWSLSFQQVEQESLAAADLLRLFAFLDPETIPEEIIMLGAPELGSALAAVADDPLQVDAMIELLLSYSLIRRIPEARFLSIHRLVQAVLIDGMDRETQVVWAERAIRAVSSVFPDIKQQDWERCQRCLPHVQQCAIYSKEYGLTFPEAARLFNEAASYLMVYARYDQAEQLLLIARSVRRKLLKSNHPDTARIQNDLGALYSKQGKYHNAIPLLQEALTVRQQVLGEEHAEVAQTLHHLANVYRAQGSYVQAEQFYTQALWIREKTLGVNHPLTAESYYGLGKLYYSQEKYQQAERLCEQALHIQEQSLGTNHPTIASTLNMLAKIFQGQNKLDQAKEMNLHALWIRENSSGTDHPQIATIINSLVEIYHVQGQYLEAEPLIARSLKIHEQLLGAEHPFMAYSLTNQAENFFLRGDHVKAEFYYKKALFIREQSLGMNHPHTASSYYHLAMFYSALEQYEEAELCYHKALLIREAAFGSGHPIIANTLKPYAALLRTLQREGEAREIEARIQAIDAK